MADVRTTDVVAMGDGPIMVPERLGLSDKQVGVANIIVEEFLKAGFGGMVAAAAVANAFRESSLDPRKESDTKRYIGLFQLSPDVISSAEARKDARKNTRGIISEALKAKRFMEVAATETDIPTLAAAFCRYVERPKDKDGESVIRAQIAENLYPVDLLQNSPYMHEPKAPPYRAPSFLGLDEDQQKVAVWLAVGAAVAGGLAYVRYLENKRRRALRG